jgi:hypothetical protein
VVWNCACHQIWVYRGTTFYSLYFKVVSWRREMLVLLFVLYNYVRAIYIEGLSICLEEVRKTVKTSGYPVSELRFESGTSRTWSRSAKEIICDNRIYYLCNNTFLSAMNKNINVSNVFRTLKNAFGEQLWPQTPSASLQGASSIEALRWRSCRSPDPEMPGQYND